MPTPCTYENDVIWLIANANQALADWNWPADALELTTCLRKSCSPTQTHLLCELLELRHRAKSKYSRANEMYFHRRGWEQATDETIAEYKAVRFARHKDSVIDLCCGIGGDAIGLVQDCNQVTVLDRDPATSRFAQANAEIYSPRPIQVLVGDVRNVALHDYAQWHIDPDRRPDERRRSDPSKCEPPLNEFLALPGLSNHGAIKLSPAADANGLLERGAELEWIGHRRECQQQVAWFGELARNPGKRSATWIDRTGNATTIVQTKPLLRQTIELTGHMPKYLYEPKPAVLAAHLEHELALQEGLVQLTTKAAYYAADHLAKSPLLAAFEVIDDLPFHQKSLVSRLAELDATAVEVKKRRVAIEPAKLMKELQRQQGSNPVTLVFYPQASGVRVAITRRLRSVVS